MPLNTQTFIGHLHAGEPGLADCAADFLRLPGLKDRQTEGWMSVHLPTNSKNALRGKIYKAPISVKRIRAARQLNSPRRFSLTTPPTPKYRARKRALLLLRHTHTLDRR